MLTRLGRAAAEVLIRPAAVADAFYPADPDRLRALVTWQLAEAEERHPAPSGLTEPDGILVPHAGLVYSGVVAASGWRVAMRPGARPATVVLLGTNHGAGWLEGVGVWDHGAWRTALGDAAVDDDLASAIVGLGPPFLVDRDAHRAEHSIEVQLPFLRVLAGDARIVPLAVACGVGAVAVDAGARLGELIARRRHAGERIVVAISTDMAHYPPHDVAQRITTALLPAILAVDPAGLAEREHALRKAGAPGLACGMCGIEPAVVGLAALRAVGAVRGSLLAAATSADAGGGADRTVGYLSAAFGMG